MVSRFCWWWCGGWIYAKCFPPECMHTHTHTLLYTHTETVDQRRRQRRTVENKARRKRPTRRPSETIDQALVSLSADELTRDFCLIATQQGKRFSHQKWYFAKKTPQASVSVHCCVLWLDVRAESANWLYFSSNNDCVKCRKMDEWKFEHRQKERKRESDEEER